VGRGGADGRHHPLRRHGRAGRDLACFRVTGGEHLDIGAADVNDQDVHGPYATAPPCASAISLPSTAGSAIVTETVLRPSQESAMPAVPLSQVAVHLHPEDNIAIAARPLPPGAELLHDHATLSVTGRVGLGHKLALRPIHKGEAIRKYGQIIGFASQD